MQSCNVGSRKVERQSAISRFQSTSVPKPCKPASCASLRYDTHRMELLYLMWSVYHRTGVIPRQTHACQSDARFPAGHKRLQRHNLSSGEISTYREWKMLCRGAECRVCGAYDRAACSRARLP